MKRLREEFRGSWEGKRDLVANSSLSDSGIWGPQWLILKQLKRRRRRTEYLCDCTKKTQSSVNIPSDFQVSVGRRINLFSSSSFSSSLVRPVSAGMLSETHYWPVFDVRFGMWHMDEQQMMCRPSSSPLPSRSEWFRKKHSSGISDIMCDVHAVPPGCSATLRPVGASLRLWEQIDCSVSFCPPVTSDRGWLTSSILFSGIKKQLWDLCTVCFLRA